MHSILSCQHCEAMALSETILYPIHTKKCICTSHIMYLTPKFCHYLVQYWNKNMQSMKRDFSHLLFHGDQVYCTLRRAKSAENFISSGKKIVERVRCYHYDPVHSRGLYIIELKQGETCQNPLRCHRVICLVSHDCVV